MFTAKIRHYLAGLMLAVSTMTSVASVDARRDFEGNLNRLLSENGLPGAVVHIRHHNKLVLHRAFGLVNLDRPEVLEVDDIFRIFSMTKPLTAVALLQLVDRGLVTLDADIRSYLPDFEVFEFNGKQQVITVHQLLTHTAGFGYGGGLKNWVDIRYLLANPLSRDNTLAELVDDVSGIDLKFAPGSKFEYSIASDIQGAIIEAVTHQPLDQYLRENVFAPLNMVDTGFFVPRGERHRLVDMYEFAARTFEQAYVFDRDKIEFVEYGNSSEYLRKPTLLSGGGGLVSTAQDYANFVQMLLNDGEFNGNQVLSPSLTRTMLSSHTRGLDTHFLPRVYDGVGFGYGVGVKEIRGETRSQGTFFWGGMGGTVFWADPAEELQVVVMFQVEDGWIAMEKWMIPQIYKLIDQL
ncbi:serine hydrolase domain-containing protein [Parahaliea mediterranea]|uniref:Beta-lactamase family protein n=1 Tax=Parahaliea mediterranea TaxID=651086 RepID=A0A939DF25_9GAMM|nr:serine hydrolase domain-containing protein [Parahaliea mediterranea]MBN7796945.1 beta-lactamase family protein [Parahaliea mediterranea]